MKLRRIIVASIAAGLVTPTFAAELSVGKAAPGTLTAAFVSDELVCRPPQLTASPFTLRVSAALEPSSSDQPTRIASARRMWLPPRHLWR